MVAEALERPNAGAGRFAPSPTSELHLGNLRTALLSWLFARSEGRSFIVRIEDLDQRRVAAARGVAERQLADLEALGLDWDSEVVRQSERLDLYVDAASRLPSYECFCSRRDIVNASRAPHGDFRPYPGTCARLSAADRAERSASGRPAAMRVRAGGARVSVRDRHAGIVSGDVDDFVLLRADGIPAYNLAVVVDDAAQGIGQVCRGSDLLSSAPRQAWLLQQLGSAPPEYVHVGLAVNQHGKRLAKRDGAVTLRELRSQGWSTAEVVRLLAHSCGFPDAASPAELLAGIGHGVDLDAQAIWQPWVVRPDSL